MAHRVEVPADEVMVCVFAEMDTYPAQKAFLAKFAHNESIGLQLSPDGVQLVFPLGTVLNNQSPPATELTIDGIIQKMADYCGCAVSYSYFSGETWEDLREERGIFSIIPEEELVQEWYSEEQAYRDVEYGDTYLPMYEEYRRSL